MDEITTTAVAGRPTQLGRVRRAAATTMLALGLLVVGGVAAVNAADPSTSPTSSAEVEGSAGTNATEGTEGTQGEGRPGCDGDESTPLESEETTS
jgi:hypothetical protein